MDQFHKLSGCPCSVNYTLENRNWRPTRSRESPADRRFPAGEQGSLMDRSSFARRYVIIVILRNTPGLVCFRAADRGNCLLLGIQGRNDR